MEFETPIPGQQEKSPVSFDVSDNIKPILTTIYNMKQKGEVLRGASATYTPEVLADQVISARDVFYNTFGGDIRDARLGRGNHIPDRADIEALPEVQRLTRSGNLRAAFVDTMVRCIMAGNNWSDQETHRLYEAIVGREENQHESVDYGVQKDNQEAQGVEAIRSARRRNVITSIADQLLADVHSLEGRAAIKKEIEAIYDQLNSMK